MRVFLRFGYAIPLWAGIIGYQTTNNIYWLAGVNLGLLWGGFVIGVQYGRDLEQRERIKL